MIDDTVRIVFLVLAGLALFLVATWYVRFCVEEITGTGHVVIDPLSVITDDGKGNDGLGTALAQMLQADLESRASEFQKAQQELALTSSPNSQATGEMSSDTRRKELVGNVRGWTPDIPLKIFLLKPLNTSLLKPIDMKLSVGGMDVGGVLPWFQKLLSSRRTLHFTLYSHGNDTEVFGSIAALRINGPGIRLVVKGEGDKPPSLRMVVDRLAYEIFRRKLATEDNTRVNLLQPEEFVNLASVIVKAGAANEMSVGGRPVKDEFVAILPVVENLCEQVPRWAELQYFAGWIADKSSDPSAAAKFYQRVLDQADRGKNLDLMAYLTAHIAQLNAALASVPALAPVSAGPSRWPIDYTEFMSAIRDSGMEGSVVGQALATAMEVQIKRSLHRDVKISARYIYNATRQVEGTLGMDTGAGIKDAINILSKEGAVEESVWPYKPGEFRATPPAAVATAARWRIAQAGLLKGLDEIRAALETEGPVVAVIDVYPEALSPQLSKNGVLPLPAKGAQAVGGHAVVLVAYDEKGKQFKFANDWGTGWGDRGYGYLSEQYLKEHSSDCWSFKSVLRTDQ
jgi:hypothetical protein